LFFRIRKPASACALVGVVKTVVNTPIIDKSGEMFEDQSEFLDVKESIELISSTN